jgi:protein-disulfide isomerase
MLWFIMRKHLEQAFFAFIIVLSLGFGASAWAADATYAAGEMALGNKAAKVVVVEYASMTCPHCASFHADTFKAFKKKYIDSGKVRFIFREFPLDRRAFEASKVARCVGESRFWPMLDVLFQQQAHWARSNDPVSALKGLARLSGIGADAVDACLNDKKLGEVILKNRMKGENEDKVRSTPSFVVNGKTVAGALTLKEMDKLLADYLPKGS